MDDFETHLKRQAPRPLPEGWRMELLAAARECREEANLAPTVKQIPAREPSHPWWLAWLWPSPYAWGTVAAAWVLILTLNAASQPEKADPAVTNRFLAIVKFQQEELAELLKTPLDPPSPAVLPHGRPGAFVLPRRTAFSC